MEVVVAVPPAPAADFNFDSTCSSPYMTAPSSPQRFGNFFLSAPASPTRSSSFVRDSSCASSSIPFDWEEKPGTPKARKAKKESDDFGFNGDDHNDDFEFDFSGQLDRASLSAEELFDGGKIKPLKPPPGYVSPVSTVSDPKSSSSPRLRTSNKKNDFDPFEAAIEETTRNKERGRARTITSSFKKSPNYVHKGSRSLSPLRVSDNLTLDDSSTSQINDDKTVVANSKFSYASSFLSAISFSSRGYKKWKLRDFLLFRSASEGRATTKDQFTKYAVLSKRDVSQEDLRNESFRSTDSSVGGSSRRRGPVSAHELHYTANRAVSEEMKRKTFLPYKRGLLGCLGFNPGVHEISRGIGSLTRV